MTLCLGGPCVLVHTLPQHDAMGEGITVRACSHTPTARCNGGRHYSACLFTTLPQHDAMGEGITVRACSHTPTARCNGEGITVRACSHTPTAQCNGGRHYSACLFTHSHITMQWGKALQRCSLSADCAFSACAREGPDFCSLIL